MPGTVCIRKARSCKADGGGEFVSPRHVLAVWLPDSCSPCPPLSRLSLMDSNLWTPRLSTPVFISGSATCMLSPVFIAPKRKSKKLPQHLRPGLLHPLSAFVFVGLLASAFPCTKRWWVFFHTHTPLFFFFGEMQRLARNSRRPYS